MSVFAVKMFLRREVLIQDVFPFLSVPQQDLKGSSVRAAHRDGARGCISVLCVSLSKIQKVSMTFVL